MGKLRRKVILIAVAVIATLSLTVGAALAEDRTDALFTRIRTVYEVVNAWHKNGADLDKFVNGAIKGGLEALGDPYTNYFSPKDYNSFVESLSGTFTGIGAYLDVEGQYVVITAPIKGTPAAKAGLTNGDRILEVNGVSVVGASTDKASELIRGPEGTEVTLKIERPSEQRTITVTITRAVINVPQVDSKMLNTQVGYIQISSFGDSAVTGFYTAVEDLKKQGAKALVLDLRQNPGGYLDAAVQIGSAFVPPGKPIVWEVRKNSKSSIDSRGLLIEMPVSVLVDGGSASASEILAGAIQDYGAGTLVGTKTFGKGTVQQLLDLTEGGAMKVTIAEYLTGKERHVDGKGLTPDVVIENPKPDPEHTQPMAFKRMLSVSSVGLDVLYLQYRLQDLGYTPDTDGFFGNRTEDAVKQFIEDNRLTGDPLVGEKFIQVLNQKVDDHWKSSEKQDLQLQKALELAQEKVK